MLPAIPIVLTSGFMWLLALTSRVTFSDIYTASAVVYYGNRLARTAVESTLLLPMPGYVQEGPGISTDLAVFVALSPIGSPVGRASPTLGECVGTLSSAITSFVRSGHPMTLRLTALTPLFGFPVASAPLGLEPSIGALDNSSVISNGSAHPAFGPLYLDFTLAIPPVSFASHEISVSSELGLRGRGSGSNLVLEKSLVLLNTCTFSGLGSCGLGDYGRRSSAASTPSAHLGNVPVLPRPGWCAHDSEGAHGILSVSGRLVPDTCTLSDLGSCGIGSNVHQIFTVPPPGFPSALGWPGHGTYTSHGSDSCGLSTKRFSPPFPAIGRIEAVCHPDWLDPDTAGSWLLVLLLVAVYFWIVYRLVDVAQTDLMVAAPGVVQAMNGAVRRYNRMPPATCPLDFFNPHLFDIRKPPLDPMRFFTPKLFQLPREVPVVDPAEFFVPNLFTLPRPAPNHLLDFFAPRLFRQPRPSDWLISCVADPLELFVPELFTLERLGLLPQLLMDLEALDEFIAKEKRWDEEMDAKLAELDTRFAYLDRQEKEGNKRLQKNWALSGKRLVGRRAGNQLKESNKPREGVAAWEERQKEGGGVAQEGGMEAKPKQSRDGAVAARGVKFEASRRRDRGANQGGGGRSGVGASRGQGDGSNGGQGVVASTSASGSRRALGKAMGGVGRV